MSENAGATSSEGEDHEEPTITDIVAGLTWEELTSDGIITLDELDAMIRARGGDPSAYDRLESGRPPRPST